jgi:hypothetical protein
VAAAQRDTSVSALFFDFIDSLEGTDNRPYDEVMDSELAVMRQGLFEVGAVSWTRDDLHDRSVP